MVRIEIFGMVTPNFNLLNICFVAFWYLRTSSCFILCPHPSLSLSLSVHVCAGMCICAPVCACMCVLLLRRSTFEMKWHSRHYFKVKKQILAPAAKFTSLTFFFPYCLYRLWIYFFEGTSFPLATHIKENI